MEQQQANSAPSPPTSSASTGTLGGNSAAGGAVLASTADSIGVTAETNNVTVLPHRRRLGKTTARPLAETKRDGSGGPPGFGTSSIPSPSLASPGTPASPGAPGSFRERVALRSSGKADLAGDQHGVGGSSKPGRSPHSNTGAPEPRHLGRRPEVNLRRHEAGQAQKYADGQQAKRAALLRAQTSGSAGNFKTFDSSHNNYLVPVIPLQFAAKQ